MALKFYRICQKGKQLRHNHSIQLKIVLQSIDNDV